MKHSAKIVGQGRIVGRRRLCFRRREYYQRESSDCRKQATPNAGGKSRLPRFPQSTLDCLWLNVLRGLRSISFCYARHWVLYRCTPPNPAGGYAESLENLPVPVKCACADNVLPRQMFASVEAWQLFSRLHRHRPGVVVFKEAAERRLRIYRIQLQGMGPHGERLVNYADSLEPDDRIDRRETSNRNGRVEEKLGVEVQDVALINHGHAIDLERDVKPPEDTQVYKLVGRCAVGVIRAEQSPQRKDETLPSVKSNIEVTGCTVPRSVRQRQKYDMIVNKGVAVAISRNVLRAEEPALIKLEPAGERFTESVRLPVQARS